MVRLRVAVLAALAAALAWAPAAARATVTQSQITSWVSSTSGTPPNSPYLISIDNPPSPTTLDVTGTATATLQTDEVDVVCFYGGQSQFSTLASAVPIGSDGTFDTGAVPLRKIAGHACRLRAVPFHGAGPSTDNDTYAGPQVAVSEAFLPAAVVPNTTTPYNVYINDVTFTGFAAWSAAGTPSPSLKHLTSYACGGPDVAPISSAFDLGNFAIDCAGSLLSDDLGAWGGRSEIQIDGRNAYDPAAAQALFAPANGNPGSQDLPGFPTTLGASVDWDPSSGLISSNITEPFVACDPGPNAETPTYANCSSFAGTGVQLERSVTTSDGGRVVKLTDTWSSTDGQGHLIDLLYDDVVGVSGNGDGERGFQFPGQAGFTQYGTGDAVAAPAFAPGSILARTNVLAPDGDPSEAFGAITFGSAPSGFRFAGNSELEEHNVLLVPAGGSASLSYVYSVGYSLADVQSLALAAQDHFQQPAIAITSPATGATVATSTVSLSGFASAGSGITSLSVAGQTVPVGPGGAWSANIPLSPGANPITALATDGAGATAQAQVTVLYQPPPPPVAPTPPPSPSATCKVPRTNGMKLRAAERALRRAHCRVGKVVRRRSSTIRRERVIGTFPRAGRRLPGGRRVEIFESAGR